MGLLPNLYVSSDSVMENVSSFNHKKNESKVYEQFGRAKKKGYDVPKNDNSQFATMEYQFGTLEMKRNESLLAD